MPGLTMYKIVEIIEDIRRAKSMEDLELTGIKVGEADLSPIELRMVEVAAQRQASMLVQNYG